jgi:hypothetical protein
MTDVRSAPDDKTYVVHLYLSEGSLQYQEEVLVFDFNDLVGNVGGYLGLLLGTSLLSMLDWSHDAARYLNKRNVK